MEGYTQAVLWIDLSLHTFKELSSAIFPTTCLTMSICVYVFIIVSRHEDRYLGLMLYKYNKKEP